MPKLKSCSKFLDTLIICMFQKVTKKWSPCGPGWLTWSLVFWKGHCEKHFCEIILNQWFRRKCCLKITLIYSSGCHFVLQSGSVCTILVEGNMKHISVKLFCKVFQVVSCQNFAWKQNHWTTLKDDLQRIFSLKFGDNPSSGFRDVIWSSSWWIARQSMIRQSQWLAFCLCLRRVKISP